MSGWSRRSVAEVSVVIPAYNAVRYVAQTIERALAQTFADHEILVIDDGSTDGTERVVRAYPRVRYHRQDNRGVAVARNRGIAEARGRYVAFLDADDLWLPHKLERQLGALRTAPACRACYSPFLAVDPHLREIGLVRRPRGASALEDLLRFGNVIGTPSTVLCERTLLEDLGGFDPDLSLCADWDLWIRLAAQTEFAYVDEPLVHYRWHAGNMSRDVALLDRESVRTLEKAFAMPGLPEALRARRRSALGRNQMVLAGSYFRAGRYRELLRCAARAVSLAPGQALRLLAFPLRVAAGYKERLD
jgi:glycosyltransferase involved in cell wall biosynthesis